MSFVNIGLKNTVNYKRIVSISSPSSSPMKRVIKDARDNGMLIDNTEGRRNASVIVIDSGHIILSAISPEAITGRINKDEEIRK